MRGSCRISLPALQPTASLTLAKDCGRSRGVTQSPVATLGTLRGISCPVMLCPGYKAAVIPTLPDFCRPVGLPVYNHQDKRLWKYHINLHKDRSHHG